MHLKAEHSRLHTPQVALLTLDFPPQIGGVQQYLFELSRRVGRHCNLTVVLPRANPSHYKEEPFRVVSVPSAAPWHFGRVLATLRPHLTVVGHTHPRLLLPSALLSRGRYIALAHGNDFEAAQRRWHSAIFNRFLMGARSLVTNSRANAQRLQELGLPAPEVILPGTDPHRFTPSPAFRHRPACAPHRGATGLTQRRRHCFAGHAAAAGACAAAAILGCRRRTGATGAGATGAGSCGSRMRCDS